MHSNDIDFMVKQANILGRLARGVGSAVKAVPKGGLYGGLIGSALALPTMGLAPALGIGAASGAVFGGAARGAIGGLRGLLSKAPASLAKIPPAANPAEFMKTLQQSNKLLSPTSTTLGGLGLGYMISDEDNKLLGSAIGAGLGAFGRPALMNIIKERMKRPPV